MAWQLVKREAAKASPTSAVLLLPVVPHVGETDTDTLTEIPARPAETMENKEQEEVEVEEEKEEEDEFGYNWSEFTLSFCEADSEPQSSCFFVELLNYLMLLQTINLNCGIFIKYSYVISNEKTVHLFIAAVLPNCHKRSSKWHVCFVYP